MTPETAVRTLQQAVQVLTVLLGPERVGTRGRGEFAALATGSAHGLDDGTWLARLVQRGIALAHGTEFPGDAAGQRALWRLVSVTPDEVSSTVLTYGLRPVGGGWREQALRERADHHAEAHPTSRDLHDLQLPAGTVIHIDGLRACRSRWGCTGRHFWWRWADRQDEPLEASPVPKVFR